MSDPSELVAEYHYGDGHVVWVYAYFESIEALDKRLVEFFDCFDGEGTCLNEGDPLYAMPSWADCARYVSPFLNMRVKGGK
jgi:hypothetical protein